MRADRQCRLNCIQKSGIECCVGSRRIGIKTNDDEIVTLQAVECQLDGAASQAVVALENRSACAMKNELNGVAASAADARGKIGLKAAKDDLSGAAHAAVNNKE